VKRCVIIERHLAARMRASAEAATTSRFAVLARATSARYASGEAGSV